MKRKPIRVDWEDLESAFDNKREDLVYYLDLVTGQVVLEGEGEEDDFEADDEMGNDEPPRASTTRLYVEPPGPDDETRWMEEFVREGRAQDGELSERLEKALEEPDAFLAFREALKDHAEARDRWFLFRLDRIRETIDAWIDANEVHTAEPPPWRS